MESMLPRHLDATPDVLWTTLASLRGGGTAAALVTLLFGFGTLLFYGGSRCRRDGAVDAQGQSGGGAAEPTPGPAAHPLEERLAAHTKSVLDRLKMVQDLQLTANSNRVADHKQLLDRMNKTDQKIQELRDRVEQLTPKDYTTPLADIKTNLLALHKGVKQDITVVRGDTAQLLAAAQGTQGALTTLQAKLGTVTAVLDALPEDLQRMTAQDSEAAQKAFTTVGEVSDMVWSLQESQKELQNLLEATATAPPMQGSAPTPGASMPPPAPAPRVPHPNAPVISLAETVPGPNTPHRGQALVLLPGGGQLTLDAQTLARLCFH
ncbi:unnamed protein product [Symbiodinium natans]|uniref:Uncharacterized protein n=1 Tax=Symbiodinium natans TaxID=878477 RepID=A0A812I1X7_9DINO|nr:unnamed protein product [Symbiodinium natans]